MYLKLFGFFDLLRKVFIDRWIVLLMAMLLKDYVKTVPDVVSPRDMECPDDESHDEEVKRYKEIGKLIDEHPLGFPSCRSRGHVNLE